MRQSKIQKITKSLNKMVKDLNAYQEQSLRYVDHLEAEIKRLSVEKDVANAEAKRAGNIAKNINKLMEDI